MESTNSQLETQVLLEQLKSEHADLEKRLNELNSHLSLTSEEELEKRQIQKLKLAKKDKILMLQKSLSH